MIETKQNEETKKLQNWPVRFFVCHEHKRKFFSGYDLAIEKDVEHCVLCHPAVNDSLGG